LRRSISIVIPAYNEEQRLGPTLTRIRQYLDSAGWEFAEILVVNDGSRDATAKVARASGNRVLENPGNRGKGYTVRHGMLEAKGDWILYTDADLSAPIEELEKLWTAVKREKAEGAIGSRAVDRSLVGIHQPVLREFVGRFFNLVMRIVTGLPFRDTQCGFKFFRSGTARQIFSRQQLEGFGFDVEVLFIARKLGLKILEVPVRWNNVEGTKVSLWSGAKAFIDPLRIRWNSLRGLYR
jgi:glycosyltransferase involved in cell wall biosynthesis